MTDLVSLVVQVRPPETIAMPGNLGRAVNALFLRWLDDYDPQLSQYWHDFDGMKPFTCSSLVGGEREGQDTLILQADVPVWFRLTALNADIACALLAKRDNPPESIDLDGNTLTIDMMTTDPNVHRWANSTDYSTLSAPYLMAKAQPPRRVHMRFLSPTFFRQQGMTTAVPLPDLVFGNLAQRWNSFSTVAVSDAVREYAQQCMAMSRYNLRSQVFVSKNAIRHMGGVGKATYVGVHFDRYWMSVAALLAEYAFYAGVGRATTVGGGQAQRVAP